MTTRSDASLLTPDVLRPALLDSLRKLDPRVQVRNPVMLVVEVGAAITTLVWILQALGVQVDGGEGGQAGWFTFVVTVWLWLTVVFANLAEALAEGRGKAQADTLRAMRTDTVARMQDGGEKPAADLRPGDVVVELCCGAAAVATALAAAVPGLVLHAADVDPGAVACARRNLVAGQVHEGDLDAPLPAELRGHVAVVVADAPYVPTGEIALMPPEARDHEPRVALDGGADGLDLQRRVATAAPRWLAPGGHVLIETSVRQAPLTAAAVAAAVFRARVHRCEERDATAVVGTRP